MTPEEIAELASRAAQARKSQESLSPRDLAARARAARAARTPRAVGGASAAATDGVLFGFGDEYLAGLSTALGVQPDGEGGANWFDYSRPMRERYSTALDAIRSEQEQFREDRPGLSIGSEVAGGVAGALTAGGGALAANVAQRGLVPRLATSAGAGAAGGATYAFGEGEDGLEARLAEAPQGAALGAAGGVAATAAAGGVKKIADALMRNRAINQAARQGPTTEALRTMGRQGYDDIAAAGVEIRPEAFDRVRGAILSRLQSETGFDELPGPGSLTPNTARVMQIMNRSGDEMAQEPTAALPFRSLDQMRRQAGAAAGNVANRSDQQAGMTVIDGLDDFVQQLAPDDVTQGDIAALQEAIPRARDLWSRMSRSQQLEDAIAQEGNYVSGGASAIRNQFSRILRNERLRRGFSDAEQAAMQRVVQGTVPEQIINLLGGGIGQLTQMGVGAGVGGLPGAIAGTGAAMVSRAASEAVTARNAERARAAIASGLLRGPNAIPQLSAERRALIEAMTRGGAVTQVQ